MSTRSGKRIHNSFHENLIIPEAELVAHSERKSRNKRSKENIQEVVINSVKSKRRSNYVSFPTDDENETDTVNSKKEEGKNMRILRKNALKERNNMVTLIETVEPSVDVRKSVRSTRRTRKFPEDAYEDAPEQDTDNKTATETQKSKKGKKKKKIQAEVTITKTKSKKKKGRGSGSLIIEDIEPEKALNKSNMSIESFHSAAGSPMGKDSPVQGEKCPDNIETFENDHTEEIPRRRTRSISKLNGIPNSPNDSSKLSRKRKSSTKDIDKCMKEIESEEECHQSKKRKSIIVTVESNEEQNNEEVNTTFGLENDRNSTRNATFDKTDINTTYDKDASNLANDKPIRDTTFDIIEEIEIPTSSGRKSLCKSVINTTYEKSANNSLVDANMRKSIINTTYEKNDNDSILKTEAKSSIHNDTFDKNKSSENINKVKNKKSSQKLSNTFDIKGDSTFDKPAKLDTTFEKDKTINTTFVKNSDSLNSFETVNEDKNRKSQSSNAVNNTLDKTEKLDTTFDKNSKSSLLSSDSSTMDKSNVTPDKSDISRISITSDESKENIVNTTPLLIESSLEESLINETNMIEDSPKLSHKNSLQDLKNSSKLSLKSLLEVSSPDSSKTPEATSKSPFAPLKREGTFTKDGPEVSASPNQTPEKCSSLPSPGYTPFPIKSGSKDRPMLNITRSIEKSRRSSLVEPLPRTTKVMFCSPVNDAMVVMQHRRKVIKSSLKGSNKSFVFDESVSSERRAAPRKRSYTYNDVEDTSVKRTRLGDTQQRSVDRLSRPRTSSASAKLAEPTTPSKKTPTKSKPVRTKLPNFAALHQRNFDKMESLGECQERKAKRARQLLTPTGAVTVLERTSPKDNIPDPPKPPPKPKEPKPKEPEPKKPETPVKSLPTFKSLNPGYTRFGFKLNLDANPFSVPSKNKISRSEGNIFNFSTKKDKGLFQFASKKDGTNEVKLKRQVTAPSLAGATSTRREVAKQTVMREKSFTDKRKEKRNENRTVIKGVRTNRRFELQMRMRNLD